MSKETFGQPFEQREVLKAELEELKTLNERRELLQQHWSELVEKQEELESKYSWEVRFDEEKKHRGDRSFLTPEDKAEFDILKERVDSVKAERDELDREILKKRFDLGLKYLAEINQQEDVIWQEIHEHNPDPKNHLDTLYSKQWRAKIGDNTAEVDMTGETGHSFFEGMKHVAEEIGDTKVLEALKKWPKERELDFNEVRLSFLISPKSSSKKDKELAPGLNLTRRFDSYDEAKDNTEIHLPLSYGAYAFPKIKKEEQERARNEMVALGKKLGVASF